MAVNALKVKHVGRLMEGGGEISHGHFYILGDARKFDSSCLCLLAVYHMADMTEVVRSDGIDVDPEEKTPEEIVKELQSIVDEKNDHYAEVMETIGRK